MTSRFTLRFTNLLENFQSHHEISISRIYRSGTVSRGTHKEISTVMLFHFDIQRRIIVAYCNARLQGFEVTGVPQFVTGANDDDVPRVITGVPHTGCIRGDGGCGGCRRRCAGLGVASIFGRRRLRQPRDKHVVAGSQAEVSTGDVRRLSLQHSAAAAAEASTCKHREALGSPLQARRRRAGASIVQVLDGHHTGALEAGSSGWDSWDPEIGVALPQALDLE